MYCSNCGLKIESDANYCSNCGYALKPVSSLSLDERYLYTYQCLISRYYPLDEVIVSILYQDLDWSWISSTGTNISWSVSLISKFKSHINWDQLSGNRSFPFSEIYLKIFSDFWNWDNLSENESIEFTNNIIHAFEKKWNWSKLYFNASIKAHVRLLDMCEGNHSKREMGLVNIPWTQTDYKSLMKITYSNFNVSVFEKYKTKWDWNLLSQNNAIPWTLMILKKYKEKLNWEELSKNEAIEFNFETLKTFEDSWNWKHLQKNPKVKWTNEILRKFESRLTIQELNYNENVEWTDELLDKYSSDLDFRFLSSSKNIVWSPEMLFKYEWDFSVLCSNEFIPWTNDFINYYLKTSKENIYEDGGINLSWPRLDLYALYKNSSFNKAIIFNDFLIEYNNAFSDELPNPISIETIRQLKPLSSRDQLKLRGSDFNDEMVWEDNLFENSSKWDWRALSYNSMIPWNIGLIERYKDKWDWDALCCNPSINWSMEMIDKFQDRINWGKWEMGPEVGGLDRIHGLSESVNVDWSLEGFYKYYENIDFIYLLHNHSIYQKIFEPIFNPEIVVSIFKKLSILRKSRT